MRKVRFVFFEQIRRKASDGSFEYGFEITEIRERELALTKDGKFTAELQDCFMALIEANGFNNRKASFHVSNEAGEYHPIPDDPRVSLDRLDRGSVQWSNE